MAQSRTITLSPRLRAAVASMLVEDRRMDAVKLIRRDHDLSLKESLKIVNGIVNRSACHFDMYPPKQHRRPFPAMLIAAVVFLVVCVGLGAAAYRIHQTNQRRAADGVVVSGRVVGYQSNGKSTAPIVEYTFDNKTYEYRSNVYTSLVDYPIGSDVRLMVDPGTPHAPLIDDGIHRYTGVMILSVLSVGMAFGCCVTLVVAVSQP